MAHCTLSPVLTMLRWSLIAAAALLALAECKQSSEPMAPVDLPDEKVEEELEKKSMDLHRLDSLTLMIYVLLMIFTVLTAWALKHMRVRWIPLHETGFTLMLGALVGLIILLCVRYELPYGEAMSRALAVGAVNGTELALLRGVPPYHTQLRMGMSNYTYNYRLEEGFNTEPRSSNLLEEEASFSPEVFFNILLPPIIFHAGYGMKKKQFFRNIGSIMAFAFAGTTISCFFVGLCMYGLSQLLVPGIAFSLQEMLYFGALISATDPVTILAIFSDLGVEQDLYALVFGESVLNDAVAIVLATTIEFYIGDMSGHGGGSAGVSFAGVLLAFANFIWVFGGSFLIGASVGCLCALCTKFTDIERHPMLETSLFLLMSYLSFLAAEAAQLTGIVAVLFCGMCQAHYTYNNLSDESQSRTKQFFEALNFLSENFIFMYIGVSLFTSHSSQFNFWFALAAIICVVLARCIHIYGLSFLLNLKRKPAIPMNYQHMLVFAGLRGAIAYAIALRNTSTVQRKYIYTATSLIVTFTVLINGGCTQFAIEKLGIRFGARSEHETHQLEEAEGAPPAGEEEGDSPSSPRHRVHYNPWDKAFLPRKWYNFDANFMKPLLTHARPSLMESAPACCKPLGRILTSTRQMVHVPNEARDAAGRDGGNMDYVDLHVPNDDAHSAESGPRII